MTKMHELHEFCRNVCDGQIRISHSHFLQKNLTFGYKAVEADLGKTLHLCPSLLRSLLEEIRSPEDTMISHGRQSAADKLLKNPPNMSLEMIERCRAKSQLMWHSRWCHRTAMCFSIMCPLREKCFSIWSAAALIRVQPQRSGLRWKAGLCSGDTAERLKELTGCFNQSLPITRLYNLTSSSCSPSHLTHPGETCIRNH